MKSKDEASQLIRDHITMIETQMGIKVKILKSDRGPEYITQETIINFLKEKGIVGEYTEIFAPEEWQSR